MMIHFSCLNDFPWENLIPFICTSLQQESKAIFPRQTITFTFFNKDNSFFKYGKQFSNSSFSGLFCGGAHLIDAVMYALIKQKPSPILSLVVFVAKPLSSR